MDFILCFPTTHFWAWCLPWRVVHIPSVTPLEDKPDFPNDNRYLIISSFLVRGRTSFLFHLLHNGILYVLTYAGLLNAATVSMNSYVYQSCCVWKTLDSVSLEPSTASSSSFCLFFLVGPWVEGRGFIKQHVI